ncbi:RBBP9/YdeN family alpha/beta hydrolase [Deinococcus arenicola]|uniref:Alpha/beta hydrolase n=1 Tax=Deinococcus arenicola TaxID=2994950 RepID=A0ABU4DT55_9DEIO|nr:alpha/beta hydrolase [Deinococcus sp. ZS9-10]MDV6375142.1 alpha/beta hydrolase [Deinococcus sp. ZS9-10]
MTPTIIIVPGLGDSGEQHWQTLWQRKFGAERVRQDNPEHPVAEVWAARLHEVIEATPGELVLVAHSAGVATVAHWAQLSSGCGDLDRVRGALLVAPADPEQSGLDTLHPQLAALAPLPTAALPFPALLVYSENDPYCTPERAEALAEAWGAAAVSAGEAGHINVESGHGDWPDGEILLSEVLHAWTPPDVVRF